MLENIAEPTLCNVFFASNLLLIVNVQSLSFVFIFCSLPAYLMQHAFGKVTSNSLSAKKIKDSVE